MTKKRVLELAKEYKEGGYKSHNDVAYRICKDFDVAISQQTKIFDWVEKNWEQI